MRNYVLGGSHTWMQKTLSRMARTDGKEVSSVLQGMSVHRQLEWGRKKWKNVMIRRHEPQGPGIVIREKKNVLEMALGIEDLTIYFMTLKKSMIGRN